VLGQNLGEHLVHAQVACHCLGHLVGIAGDHHHTPAEALQLRHRLPRLGADLVLQRQCADDLVPPDDEQHGGATRLPFLQPFGQRRGLCEIRSRSNAGPPTA